MGDCYLRFSHSYPALHCELDDGSLAFLRKKKKVFFYNVFFFFPSIFHVPFL